MGNQCCAGRDDARKRKANAKHMGAAGSKSFRQLFSFGAGDDVVRFDLAYDNNDIAEFVKLCHSTCEIEKLEERMHPWAADPETIGALAATQLAILASREHEPHTKDEVREAGGIEALVEMLNSKALDRLHAAVVALSFLSVENSENCVAMYDAGALPYLVNGMKGDIDGMRAACAQTARNIYVLSQSYRGHFIKAGGVTQLVRLLDLPAETAGANQTLYTQLEAIYHLEDLILDGGDEIPEFTEVVKSAGAAAKLRILQDSNDSDIAEAANLLLVRLSE